MDGPRGEEALAQRAVLGGWGPPRAESAGERAASVASWAAAGLGGNALLLLPAAALLGPPFDEISSLFCVFFLNRRVQFTQRL